MIQCGKDADGWSLDDKFSFEDIQPSHIPALQSVVQNILSIQAEWQAIQVYAYKGRYKISETDTGELDATGTPIMEATYGDCIDLRVEARHVETGRYATFTYQDYDCLRITDVAALEFFDFYSKKII